MKVNKHQADERAVYRIQVQGILDDLWSDWFSDLSVDAGDERSDAPVTTLTGPIDQAALRGILNRIWDLNLSVVSVVPVEANEPLDGGAKR